MMKNRHTLGELLRSIGDSYPIKKETFESIYRAVMEKISVKERVENHEQ